GRPPLHDDRRRHLLRRARRRHDPGVRLPGHPVVVGAPAGPARLARAAARHPLRRRRRRLWILRRLDLRVADRREHRRLLGPGARPRSRPACRPQGVLMVSLLALGFCAQAAQTTPPPDDLEKELGKAIAADRAAPPPGAQALPRPGGTPLTSAL